MRKKMFGLTAAAVCLAMLAGCGAGGGEAAQPYTKEQAQEILDCLAEQQAQVNSVPEQNGPVLGGMSL